MIQSKVFLTKLKGTLNLFVKSANFFRANMETKKTMLRELRIYFFSGEFSLQACSLEPYLTVYIYLGQPGS